MDHVKILRVDSSVCPKTEFLCHGKQVLINIDANQSTIEYFFFFIRAQQSIRIISFPWDQ